MMNVRTHGLKTLVGSFEDENAAEAAIRELRAVGFSASQIGVVSPQTDWSSAIGRTNGSAQLWQGELWGLRSLVSIVPGFGPAIAGGVLAALFWSTATIGAAGALVGLGVSEEDAQQFEDRFREGHTIVTVAGGTRADIALSVLNRFSRSNRNFACAT